MTVDEARVEAAAKAMWQDESLRARGAPRNIPWSEVHQDEQDRWRRSAKAALAAADAVRGDQQGASLTGRALASGEATVPASSSLRDCAPSRDRYSLELSWSDEDEGFIGRSPELPGCSFFGATREEAVAEAAHAIQAWLEAQRDVGNPIPPPRINPEPHVWLPAPSGLGPSGDHPSRMAPAAERVRHVKRGSVYEVLNRTGLLQTSQPLVDGDMLVSYRGADGQWWHRPPHEFEDGRFVPAPAIEARSAETQGGSAEGESAAGEAGAPQVAAPQVAPFYFSPEIARHIAQLTWERDEARADLASLQCTHDIALKALEDLRASSLQHRQERNETKTLREEVERLRKIGKRALALCENVIEEQGITDPDAFAQEVLRDLTAALTPPPTPA